MILRIVWLALLLSLPCLPAMADASPPSGPVMPAARDVLRRFTSDDGLPQNSVNTLVQDRHGYLWLATYGGLVRFDGSTFTVFRSTASGGPSSDRILSLWLDAGGRLWIGTEDAGITVMDRDGRFHWLPVCGGTCLVRQVFGAGPATALAVTNVGVIQIDLASLLEKGAPVEVPYYIRGAQGGDGNAYLAADAGLWIADGGPWREIPYPEGVDAGSRHLMRPLDGDVWVGFSSGLFRYSPGTGQWRRHPAQPPGPMRAIWRDLHGQLWIGNDEGVLFREEAGRFVRVKDTPVGKVGHALIDAEGTLWIGDTERGLFRILPSRVELLNQREYGLHYSGLPVSGDGKGGMWFGFICDGLRHRSADGRIRRIALRQWDGGCPWALHVEPSGALWVGLASGELLWLDASGQPRAETLVARDTSIRAIHPASDGRYWVAAGRSTFQAWRRGDGSIALEQVPALQGNLVTAIVDARAGGTWFVGDQGVQRFGNGRVVERWGVEQGLSSRFARSLYEDPEGGIWIGTYGAGLNYIANGAVHRYDTSNGLFDDVVSCILPDRQGRLWLSGNRGISVIGLGEQARARAGVPPDVIGFSGSDGLIPSETNGGSQPVCHRDEEGALWFPLLSGFARIDPERLLQSEAPPVRPVIESVAVAGQRQQATGALRLPADARNLEIGFGAPSLSAPEKVRFRFRLGNDPAWTDSGGRRSVLYPIVPWGEYDFEVEARNADGVWSGQPARLRIVHPLPLYRSPVAWVLAALLVPGLLLALGRALWRILRRQRAEYTSRLVRQRTRELEIANRSLAEQTRIDPKTGIANHRRLIEAMDEARAHCAALRRPLSLLLIDIDEFKRYNDHYGHLAGDECLARVAQAMQSQARGTDLLARYGGEEFALLMPGADAAAAAAAGERLRRAVAALDIGQAPQALHPVVTISVGHATCVDAETMPREELIAAADGAMYRAKRNGRNRVEGAE